MISRSRSASTGLPSRESQVIDDLLQSVLNRPLVTDTRCVHVAISCEQPVNVQANASEAYEVIRAGWESVIDPVRHLRIHGFCLQCSLWKTFVIKFDHGLLLLRSSLISFALIR